MLLTLADLDKIPEKPKFKVYQGATVETWAFVQAERCGYFLHENGSGKSPHRIFVRTRGGWASPGLVVTALPLWCQLWFVAHGRDRTFAHSSELPLQEVVEHRLSLLVNYALRYAPFIPPLYSRALPSAIERYRKFAEELGCSSTL